MTVIENVRDTGPVISPPTSHPFEAALGSRAWTVAVAKGRRLVAERDRSCWRLGDLALSVAPVGAHGVNTGVAALLERFADEIGLSGETLHTYRLVASSWPEERRFPSASFGAHMELRGCAEQRFELIRQATSVRHAKQLAAGWREERARNDQQRRPVRAVDGFRLLVGDARDQLHRLEDASVDAVVCSPPYYLQRHYRDAAGQIGLEDTAGEHGW